MEWLTIISLLVVGIVLVIVEIIFVPGTTIVGVLGFILGLAGLVLCFTTFGSQIGWITTGITTVVASGLFYWSLTSKAWKQFALKATLKGKVNEGTLDALTIGQEGRAVSALRPMGKAELSGKMVEVTTIGNYVESGTLVKIVRIAANQITVEPIN